MSLAADGYQDWYIGLALSFFVIVVVVIIVATILMRSAVAQINQRFGTILSVLPGIAAKAAFVVRKVTRGQAMVVLWIMCLVVAFAAVVLVILLKGVPGAAGSITPTAAAIAGVAQAASRDLDAVIALVTTQNYISQLASPTTAGRSTRLSRTRERNVMQRRVAILILLITLALALYLIATILELQKITGELDALLVGVDEIVTKTAPVNGVLDAINGTLVTGHNRLEGLALKKAGGDAAGLVESCFPGEGQRFLQRIGQRGPVAIGEEYPRGAATLNALLGVLTAASGASAAPAGRISVVGARPRE